MNAPGLPRRGIVARGISGEGRPLRFLMIAAGGWTGARVALLWTDPAAEQLITARQHVQSVARAARVDRPVSVAVPMLSAASAAVGGAIEPNVLHVPAGPGVATGRTAPSPRSVMPAVNAVAPIDATSSETGSPAPAPRFADSAPSGGNAALPVAATLPTRTRWSASVWTLVRGDGDAGGVATPQLGGSQLGARVAYRLDRAGRVAAAARFASAIGTRQQEAAVGIEWQPTRVPVRLVAEQRVGITGVRGGAALGLVGGVSAQQIGAGIRVEGYAQAGVVARARADGYVDGALVAAGTVARHGAARLELGLGAWGAAQRGAGRLDLGPSAVVVLPVERRAIRIGVQWRAHIAGNARPGSGAVLSLGADF